MEAAKPAELKGLGALELLLPVRLCRPLDELSSFNS